MKPQVMDLLSRLLAHDLSKAETVDAIDALYNPQQQHQSRKSTDYLHWVMCSKTGKVDVWHVTDCELGEDCALFKYLSADGAYERHKVKRGHDYNVTKDKDGKFIFTDAGKNSETGPEPVDKQVTTTPKQSSLLDI